MNRRSRVSFAALLPLLPVLPLVLAGCAASADPAGTVEAAPSVSVSRVRSASTAPSGSVRPSPTRTPIGFCPPSETVPSPSPSPSPCISVSEQQRYDENHAYRERLSLTDAEQEQGRPWADALLTELKKLAASSTADKTALRSGIAGALGVALNRVDYKNADSAPPLRNVEVAVGQDRVCVTGAIDGDGTATVQIVGPTLDGGCLESDGGH